MNEYDVVNHLNELEAELTALRLRVAYEQFETDSSLVLEALGSMLRASELLEKSLLKGYR